MTQKYNAVLLVVISVLFQVSITEAGDTEIWPIPTECPKVDPLDYTVHLQHESDCTKFYKCDHGNKVLFDCPGGLEFSPVLQVCVWPDEAQCTLGQQTEEPQAPNRDPECPWPDPLDHTVHLPHETDCSKFYKCDHGAKVEFDCPDGLHFNPKLEVCDWPQNAGCEGGKNVTTQKPTQAPTETESTLKPTEAPTRPPSWDSECPWPDPLNYTVHLPHEDDCTKFYKCDHGSKVEFDCPDGLHFNPKLEVCDWPENAGCEDAPATETTQKPTQSPTTTQRPTEQPTPAPVNPTTQAPTEAPTRPPSWDPECPWPDPLNYTVHLPHEDDCTKFYKCDHGSKVEFDCPDGLHFNPKLEVCDWPENAGCEELPATETTSSSRPTPPPTTTTSPPQTVTCPNVECQDSTIYLPYLANVRKYIRCVNGNEIIESCPGSLVFDAYLATCNLEHLIQPRR